MEAITVSRPDIIFPSVDVANLSGVADLSSLPTAQLVLQLPKNSILVCADRTQINVGVGALSSDVVCPEAVLPPETMIVSRLNTEHERLFVMVSAMHPQEQKVVGVIVVDFQTHGYVLHAHVLNPSWTNRAHYCGWFARPDFAADFIVNQCIPFVPKPHRRRSS